MYWEDAANLNRVVKKPYWCHKSKDLKEVKEQATAGTARP